VDTDGFVSGKNSDRGVKLTIPVPLLARIKLVELFLHSFFVQNFTFVCS
jgi:hypothetical protein